MVTWMQEVTGWLRDGYRMITCLCGLIAGLAHTFFSGATDKARAGELINVLREAGQTVPQELLAFGTTVKKKESKLYGAHFKEVDFSKKATKMTFGDSDDE
jgi:ATP-dependent RNA helicase DBP3